MNNKRIYLFFLCAVCIPALGMQSRAVRPGLITTLIQGAKKVFSRAPLFTYIAGPIEKESLSVLFPISGPEGALTRGFLEGVFQKIALTVQGRQKLIQEFNTIAEREYRQLVRTMGKNFVATENAHASMIERDLVRSLNSQEQRQLHTAIERALCEAGYIRTRVSTISFSQKRLFEECARYSMPGVGLRGMGAMGNVSFAGSAQLVDKVDQETLDQESALDTEECQQIAMPETIYTPICAYELIPEAVQKLCDQSVQTEYEVQDIAVQTDEVPVVGKIHVATDSGTQVGRRLVDSQTQIGRRMKDSRTQTEQRVKTRSIQVGNKVRCESVQTVSVQDPVIRPVKCEASKAKLYPLICANVCCLAVLAPLLYVSLLDLMSDCDGKQCLPPS